MRGDNIRDEPVLSEIDEVQISGLDPIRVAFFYEQDILEVYAARNKLLMLGRESGWTYRYGMQGFAFALCRVARYFLKLPSIDIISSSSNIAYNKVSIKCLDCCIKTYVSRGTRKLLECPV